MYLLSSIVPIARPLRECNALNVGFISTLTWIRYGSLRCEDPQGWQRDGGGRMSVE